MGPDANSTFYVMCSVYNTCHPTHNMDVCFSRWNCKTATLSINDKYI